jgi:hypothetical protein
MVGEHQRRVNWEHIRRALRHHYPELGESQVQVEEDQFRYHVSKEIERMVNEKPDPDWTQVQRALGDRYGDYDTTALFLMSQFRYCDRYKLRQKELDALRALMERYGTHFEQYGTSIYTDSFTGDRLGGLNDYIWHVLPFAQNDTAFLRRAAELMKSIAESDSDGDFTNRDTYAHVHRHHWKEPDYEREPFIPTDFDAYTQTLATMVAGKPLWTD